MRSLKGITPGTFERMVMVHNVGIFGEIMYVNNAMELDAWRKIYDINVFVPFILNAVAMKVFNDCTKKLVINITTLFAIQPQHECGYYCSAKAAREMYFKVYFKYILKYIFYLLIHEKCIIFVLLTILLVFLFLI